MAKIEIITADLSQPEHQDAVLTLIDAYAADPMGDGQPLRPEVKLALIPGLQEHPTTLILLAYADGKAAGIAVCFRGFSTFAARPLLNVHDLAVLPEYRSQGIGQRLLNAVEGEARKLGCCKLTLEVLENNRPARKLYETLGFTQATYQPEAGGALFMSKKLA